MGDKAISKVGILFITLALCALTGAGCAVTGSGGDAGTDGGGVADAGVDAGMDAGTDGGGAADAGVDAGMDAGTDGGGAADTGVDAGMDAGTDGGDIIEDGGGSGYDLVEYIHYGFPGTNIEALKSVMGDWSTTPKTYGIVGPFTGVNVDSLYHRIADMTAPTSKDTFPGGIIGTLSGSSGSQSIYSALQEVFAALDAAAGKVVIPWSDTHRDLLSWINSFSAGVGGSLVSCVDGGFLGNIKSDLHQEPGNWSAVQKGYAGGSDKDLVDYLHYGFPGTNIEALKSVMGDWSETPKTYGVVGQFVAAGSSGDSLYHRIADMTAPTSKDTFPGGIIGTLSGSSGSQSIYSALQEVFAALDAAAGKAVIPWSDTHRDLLSWIKSFPDGADHGVRP